VAAVKHTIGRLDHFFNKKKYAEIEAEEERQREEQAAAERAELADKYFEVERLRIQREHDKKLRSQLQD